jgi:hypothetical protein
VDFYKAAIPENSVLAADVSAAGPNPALHLPGGACGLTLLYRDRQRTDIANWRLPTIIPTLPDMLWSSGPPGSMSRSRKVIMVEGMRSRSIFLYLLLIAEGVQGLTPDANDLSSPTLFPMLASVASDALSLGFGSGFALRPEFPWSLGDDVPSRDEDRDQMPDDVCDPARLVARVVRVQSVGATRAPSYVLDRSQWLLIWSRLPGLWPQHPGPVPGNDLTLALCRFLC